MVIISLPFVLPIGNIILEKLHRPLTNATNIGGFAGIKNPMLNDNLAHIMHWYKGRITFESRKILADFAWQTRFYDHIIRNEQEYRHIADYITNNPNNWQNDKFYTE
jgi:hypothetical protein